MQLCFLEQLRLATPAVLPILFPAFRMRNLVRVQELINFLELIIGIYLHRRWRLHDSFYCLISHRLASLMSYLAQLSVAIHI